MRKRGYKRKSIKSQAFREERLRILQTHWETRKSLVIPTIPSFWLEHIIQEIIPFGFEAMKGRGIPCFLYYFLKCFTIVSIKTQQVRNRGIWVLILEHTRSCELSCLVFSAVTVWVQPTECGSKLLILSSLTWMLTLCHQSCSEIFGLFVFH